MKILSAGFLALFLLSGASCKRDSKTSSPDAQNPLSASDTASIKSRVQSEIDAVDKLPISKAEKEKRYAEIQKKYFDITKNTMRLRARQ